MSNSFGVALIGLVFAAIFYGVTLLQTQIYFTKYRDDNVRLKALVTGAVLLDTLHTALVTHVLWFYLVDSFGRPENLERVPWSLPAQLLVSFLVQGLVQLFFAHRVRTLSRGWLVCTLIAVCAVLQLGLSAVFVGKLVQIGNILRLNDLLWVLSTAGGVDVLADVLIAGALCYYLQKSRTGISRTDQVLTFILRYAVSTGVVTSVFHTCTVILYIVSPSSVSLASSLYFSLTKVYTNSLLASLNSREKIRHIYAADGTTAAHVTAGHANSIAFMHHANDAVSEHSRRSTLHDVSGDLTTEKKRYKEPWAMDGESTDSHARSTADAVV
jgi:hypothetical protein